MCDVLFNDHQVAKALQQPPPTLNMVQRGYGQTPEQMFMREFKWNVVREEMEGGIEVYDRTVSVSWGCPTSPSVFSCLFLFFINHQY